VIIPTALVYGKVKEGGGERGRTETSEASARAHNSHEQDGASARGAALCWSEGRSLRSWFESAT